MIKLNRNHFFIAASSIALLVVLIIQVNWIYTTAKIKEDLFNETARLVLSRTADALCSDSSACKSIAGSANAEGKRKVDSLFNHYMQEYNIHVDYYFEFRRLASASSVSQSAVAPVNSPYTPNAYATCIGPGELKGTNLYEGPLELTLIFPDREQFLAEEMGVPFVSSVLLILVVIVIFWKTTLSLLREKEVADRTTDFFNNMTHEFKTPLTNIALAGKMLQKETNIKQEEKVKYYSGIILEENDKLGQQVELMLSMSALERGEIPLKKELLDLHQVIQAAANCMNVQVEETNGQIKLKLEATNSFVNGDKQHLTSTISGLVDNAIKYAEAPPQIEVTTFNEENKLVIQISDNGIGIDDRFHSRIFEKFFRVPTGDRHNVKGFGLGLSYVKSIVEMHQGIISVESLINRGTTFKIVFSHA